MSLSRRELLATFLGAPVALAACRSRRGTIPDGELAFPSQLLGHRIRDGVGLTIASAIGADRWERASVVIVGGGVAGLTAAWRFLRAGFSDFVLLELDDVAGGTAKSGQNAISAYPWGAHYITAPMKEHRAMITLLDELGIVEGSDEHGEAILAEEHLCRDPQERIFHDGRWDEGLYLEAGATPSDREQLSRFRAELDRLSAMRDGRGRRAFSIPVDSSSDDADFTALDRVSMASWLDARGLDSPRLRWLVDYACRDDYGSTLAQTSAWAALFYFASRMREPGDDAQPIITWPEGNGRLVAHLMSRARSKVRLGVGVAELIPIDGGATEKTSVEVIAMRADGTPLGIRAERVIFAAPQFLARYVIRPWRDAPPPHVEEFAYGAWMVANLSLSSRPKDVGLPFAWDSVLYDSPSLGYVNATHQRCVDHGPTVLTYYHPLCDDDPRAARRRLLAADRVEWADVALTDLARAHPSIRELTTRLDVTRWGHAMIKPRPGFLFGGARTRAAQEHRGIHFANTDLSGVALFEEAFHHGIRAAEEILAARGIASESLL